MVNNTATLAVANGNDFAQEKYKVTVKVRFFQECVQRKIHPLFPRTDQQEQGSGRKEMNCYFCLKAVAGSQCREAAGIKQ